ncbi:ribosomal protein S18-alanine N-acetyltransferase [Candidatus Bathyarchaeota archaeon]|nr:ribosomal protein S18-alanine N-acetyltransferase [Candidatus Bathyarchaeota archaeon]
MSSLFVLRKFEPKDLHQVVYINQVCLPENYSNGFFIDLYERYPETFIVAEKDGVVVGYIMCRIESGFSGMSLKPFGIVKKGHIISIAVLPESRNLGIGQALIKEALKAMSTSYDVKSCFLEVRVSNTVALSLYKRTGFEIERTIKGYYSDGEDAYIMSRKI